MLIFDYVDGCLNLKVEIKGESHPFWNVMGDEAKTMPVILVTKFAAILSGHIARLVERRQQRRRGLG
jgi:hypothetical protein